MSNERTPNTPSPYATAMNLGREVDELRVQNAKLVAALEFYADPRRYAGSNAAPFDGDRFTDRDAPYMRDVTRDIGEIARAALKAAKVAP